MLLRDTAKSGIALHMDKHIWAEEALTASVSSTNATSVPDDDVFASNLYAYKQELLHQYSEEMDQEDPNIPSDSTGKIFEGIDQPPDVVTGSNDFISVDEYDAGIIEEIDIVPTAISREIEPVHKEAAKIGNAKTGQMDPLDEFLYWFSRRNEEDVEGSVGVTGSKSTGEPFLKKVRNNPQFVWLLDMCSCLLELVSIEYFYRKSSNIDGITGFNKEYLLSVFNFMKLLVRMAKPGTSVVNVVVIVDPSAGHVIASSCYHVLSCNAIEFDANKIQKDPISIENSAARDRRLFPCFIKKMTRCLVQQAHL
ncbi:hypothetical protein PHJA_001450900 [Phtheirospermum japonicum]|uniref:Uncharacterized protein n=1 Tax=Phtheirospermum japonicum TaxID=374723 RepID=A0A830C1T1_9LAMI|nr:hypothetical protein PHJA_001450900 [Phtheirospermum japonicum]